MPHPFPQDVHDSLARKLPRGYELFWVRCVVVQCGMASPGSYGTPYTLLKVFDCDAMAEGEIRSYEINLRGDLRKNQVEPNDAISFIGHRLKGEKKIRPRFMINHNTGRYQPAYYNVVELDGVVEGLGTAKEVLDNWLTVRVKPTLAERLGSVLAATLWLLLALGALALLIWLADRDGWAKMKWDWGRDLPGAIPYLWWLLAGWAFVALRAAFKMPSFDLSSVYESLARPIDRYAHREQLPDAGFVIRSRRTD